MEIKTETEFIKSTRLADVYTESNAEYVLPDYNGDVRKILFTEAELRPSGKFAGADEVDFSGIIVYNVIYSDAENNISSVSFTSDYDYTVKCSGQTFKDAFSDTRLANYQVRLVGPRKMTAKASVVGSPRLSERESVRAEGTAFEGQNMPQVATRGVNLRTVSSSEAVEREYAEVVERLDGAIADEVAVIYTGADVIIENTQPGDGEVTVSGNLTMQAIIKNADEPAYLATKTIPVSISVPFEGAGEEMRFIPDVIVTSAKGTVNADDTGSEVVVSVILEVSVTGEENIPASVITDAYLTSCVTENTYEDFSYEQLCEVVSVTEPYSAELARDGIESENLREIIFISATPRLESVQCKGQSLNLAGEVRFSGITSETNDDGSISYSGIKFSTPFEKNVKLSSQNPEITRTEAKISVFGVTASVDSSKAYVSCSMAINARAVSDRHVRVLATCNAREELTYEKHPSRITVYYPDSEDTLFSVAKKFHTTAAKVAADNDLAELVSASDHSEIPISGAKRIIIR